MDKCRRVNPPFFSYRREGVQENHTAIPQLGSGVVVDDIILSSQLSASSFSKCDMAGTGTGGNTGSGTTPPTSQVASGVTRISFGIPQWVQSGDMWSINFPQSPSDVDVYRMEDSVNSAQVEVEQKFNASTQTLTLVSFIPFNGFITY